MSKEKKAVIGALGSGIKSLGKGLGIGAALLGAGGGLAAALGKGTSKPSKPSKTKKPAKPSLKTKAPGAKPSGPSKAVGGGVKSSPGGGAPVARPTGVQTKPPGGKAVSSATPKPVQRAQQPPAEAASPLPPQDTGELSPPGSLGHSLSNAPGEFFRGMYTPVVGGAGYDLEQRLLREIRKRWGQSPGMERDPQQSLMNVTGSAREKKSSDIKKLASILAHAELNFENNTVVLEKDATSVKVIQKALSTASGAEKKALEKLLSKAKEGYPAHYLKSGIQKIRSAHSPSSAGGPKGVSMYKANACKDSGKKRKLSPAAEKAMKYVEKEAATDWGSRARSLFQRSRQGREDRGMAASVSGSPTRSQQGGMQAGMRPASRAEHEGMKPISRTAPEFKLPDIQAMRGTSSAAKPVGPRRPAPSPAPRRAAPPPSSTPQWKRRPGAVVLPYSGRGQKKVSSAQRSPALERAMKYLEK